jgi:hypothetical protein
MLALLALVLLLSLLLCCGKGGFVLEAHDLTTVSLHGYGVTAVEVISGLLDQESEVSLILLVNFSNGNNGGGPLVHDLSESFLALNNYIGNVLLPAQSGQPQDKLERINIVRDDDQLGLTSLNEGGDVVKTVVNDLGLGIRSGLSTSSSLTDQTGLLLGSGLRTVFIEEREEGLGIALVERVGELVNSGRNLQSLQQNLTLSLKTDVLRPTYKASQVSLG